MALRLISIGYIFFPRKTYPAKSVLFLLLLL